MKTETRTNRLLKPVDFGTAAGVLVVLLTWNFFVWRFVDSSLLKVDRINLETRASRLTQLIQDRMHRYQELASDGRDIFISHKPSRKEFVNYFEKKQEGLPEVSTVAWVERVTDLNGFISSVQGDQSLVTVGYPNFTVSPNDTKPEYYVVNYLTNTKNNQALFGYDLGSVNDLQSKIKELAQNKNTALWPKRLILNSQRASVWQPIYDGDWKLLGFVVILIDVDKLGEVIGDPEVRNQPISVAIYDRKLVADNLVGANPIVEKYFGDQQDGVGSRISRLSYVSLDNIEWTVRINSKPMAQLGVIEKTMPMIIFVINGIVAVVVVFLLLSYMTNKSGSTKNEAS